MTTDRGMKSGLTISCIGHACALILALITLSAQPMEAPATVPMPVNFISTTDFTKLTQGVKNAPELKFPEIKPQQIADKVDTTKPVDQLAPKVANKPEITTDSSKSRPPPKPDTKPADKAEKSQSKPDAKQADKADKPPPEYKPDQIADLLRKDAAKNPPKPDSQQPAAQDSPKFDADQVAALLDKRTPQRQAAAAETLNSVANLGAANGAPAAQMSQSEIDALRARISNCWSPPPGIDANSKLYVVLRVLFKPDGSMVQEPVLVEATASQLGPALAESAKRALLLCQPFTMLKPEHYDQWKDLELKFDPHELLGG
jgi:colicin import membrane protein